MDIKWCPLTQPERERERERVSLQCVLSVKSSRMANTSHVLPLLPGPAKGCLALTLLLVLLLVPNSSLAAASEGHGTTQDPSSLDNGSEEDLDTGSGMGDLQVDGLLQVRTTPSSSTATTSQDLLLHSVVSKLQSQLMQFQANQSSDR